MFQSNVVEKLRDELSEETLIEEQKQTKTFAETARWIDKASKEIETLKCVVADIDLANQERQTKLDQIKKEGSIIAKSFGQEKYKLETDIYDQEQAKVIINTNIQKLQVLIEDTPTDEDTRANVLVGLQFMHLELQTSLQPAIQSYEALKEFMIESSEMSYEQLTEYNRLIDEISNVNAEIAELEDMISWIENLSET